MSETETVGGRRPSAPQRAVLELLAEDESGCLLVYSYGRSAVNVKGWYRAWIRRSTALALIRYGWVDPVDNAYAWAVDEYAISAAGRAALAQPDAD